MTSARAPLPVTVIGGYLGAGKTTLVNHLLRHANGLRLAVLVNEFGELPIDADLIEAEGEDVISIAGGCICCSYGADLTLALMDLAKLEPRPDQVLIEASGVAIPGAVVAALGLLPDYQADGAVILADAETVRRDAADRYVGDTIARQLADADIVLMNKTDLPPPGAAAEVEAWLATAAPEARIVATSHGRVTPETLLGAALTPGRRLDDAPHANPFEMTALSPASGVDAEHLARLMAEGDFGLIRAKGFVTGPGGARRKIQIVGRRWRVDDAAKSGEDGLVAIGVRGRLRVAALRDAVEA